MNFPALTSSRMLFHATHAGGGLVRKTLSREEEGRGTKTGHEDLLIGNAN